MNDYTSYPLSWPLSWKRTPISERRRAHFSNRVSEKSSYSDSYYTRTKQVTVAEGLDRLMREIRAFTRAGNQWRIDPNRVVVSTNIRTRNDGLPYSGAKEPDDSGVAVYFNRMIISTIRIPKWLGQEWFRITCNPMGYRTSRFSVTIKNQKGFAQTFHGQGPSVAIAAKEARRKREGK